jgi:cytochrome c-type biogenesis protein CcmH
MRLQGTSRSSFPCAAGEGAPPICAANALAISQPREAHVGGADGGRRTDCPHPPPAPSPARGGRESFISVGSFLLGVCFVVIALVASGSAFAIDPLPFKDRAEEVRFQKLTKQLRCLVCQNQDLADSDADLAKDLRKQVFDMMQSGKSDDEIKQYLVARYNDFVLYDPPLKPGTWLLWFAPFAFVLIGVLVVARILRARTRQAGGVRPADTDSGDDW